ncbi:PAS domain-containing sensor histidine kinase [Gracilimonas tropica]|uniref:PAS domain-containing sensor histidine kinase n=1 Tax=Gracilimonas tropica TaxID=454600 RepID=UPI000372EF4E|nr:PAS domain S-box protein [Gracilimonas tropica]
MRNCFSDEIEMELDLVENKFKSLIPGWISKSPNLYFVITNARGDVLFSNKHFKKIFLPKKDASPINLSDLIEDTDLQTLHRNLESCHNKKDDQPVETIYRFRLKDTNRYKSVKWECSILEDEQTDEQFYSHTGYDLVAVEKQSVAEKHFDKSLNNIFDDLQIGVLVQDADSSILLSNVKAEELLGLKKRELSGLKADDKNWDIVKPDKTPFPFDDLPTTIVIREKKSVRNVVMGVYNPTKDQYVWLEVDAQPQMNENGELDRIITTFVDISLRKEIEEKAEQQRLQLRTMMDNAPMVIFMKDTEGRYLFFNRSYKDFMGLKLEPGITDYDLFDKDFSDWCKAKDQKVIEEGKSISFEHRVGEQTFFETKFPIKNADGEIFAIGGFSQDITRQKKEEEQLRLLESVITHAKDAVLITKAKSGDDQSQVITYANDSFYHQTGYSKEDIIGKPPSILEGPDSDPVELEKLGKAIENEEFFETEIINYRKNGEKYWVRFSIVPVKGEEGKVTHWISVQQNVTERKQYEKELKDALREKTYLLSEVHHRVKNNLAIVSGLLELQSMDTDQEVKLPLQRSINRIHSIAMVHELMYQTEKLSSINIKTYLDKLIPAIEQTMQIVNGVVINLDLEDFQLNINQAIPLGLLMNELLTNSFKYAFLKRFDGQIDISMNVNEHSLEFLYRDNGPGFKNGTGFQSSGTLGLSLIRAQLEQLHAEYEAITKGRFELKFTFCISERGPHSNI